MAAYPEFMTHITCRLTSKNRDELRHPTLGNRVWATFTFLIGADFNFLFSMSLRDSHNWLDTAAVSVNNTTQQIKQAQLFDALKITFNYAVGELTFARAHLSAPASVVLTTQSPRVSGEVADDVRRVAMTTIQHTWRQRRVSASHSCQHNRQL